MSHRRLIEFRCDFADPRIETCDDTFAVATQSLDAAREQATAEGWTFTANGRKGWCPLHEDGTPYVFGRRRSRADPP